MKQYIPSGWYARSACISQFAVMNFHFMSKKNKLYLLYWVLKLKYVTDGFNLAKINTISTCPKIEIPNRKDKKLSNFNLLEGLVKISVILFSEGI